MTIPGPYRVAAGGEKDVMTLMPRCALVARTLSVIGAAPILAQPLVAFVNATRNGPNAILRRQADRSPARGM